MASLRDVAPVFLEQSTAALATIGPDGQPQVTAIWFIVEDDCIAMSVRRERQKVKNLAANNKGTVLIYHPDGPDCFVEIRGEVEIVDDLDYAFADRLGPPKYQTDMRSFDQPGAHRIKLALRPTKINFFDARG